MKCCHPLICIHGRPFMDGARLGIWCQMTVCGVQVHLIDLGCAVLQRGGTSDEERALYSLEWQEAEEECMKQLQEMLKDRLPSELTAASTADMC